MAKQDEYIKTALRVPPNLHKKIHEAAATNNRTFNAEIIDRLEMALLDSQQLFTRVVKITLTTDQQNQATFCETYLLPRLRDFLDMYGLPPLHSEVSVRSHKFVFRNMMYDYEEMQVHCVFALME